MFCVVVVGFLFFVKQKTAYEMRISDWSSDVCSSDLACSLIWFCWSYYSPFCFFAATLEFPANLSHEGIPLAVEHQAAQLRTHLKQIGRASCRARVCQYV